MTTLKDVVAAAEAAAAAAEAAAAGAISDPDTSITLREAFGEESPKVLRVVSSSMPGGGAGEFAGRSIVLDSADSRAKTMIDYRFPLNPDGTIWDFNDGEPTEDAYTSVAWLGVCHYWAQDQPDPENPTELHNHISILEMPDEDRVLHTILDSPIGPHTDDTLIGSASHRIRTNRADLVVRVGNPYDGALGRAYRLKVTASTDYEKMISFHSNTSGSTAGSSMSGVRWELGALAGAESGSDVGTDFVLRRFTDTGFSAPRPFMFGERSSGKVTFGKEEAGAGRLTVLTSETTQDLFYGYPEAGDGAGTLAVYAAQVGSVSDKVFRALTGSSSPAERFHILGDGKIEWGNTATIDTNLYRSAASILATDDDFEITLSSKGLILKSPDGTRYRVQVANGGTLAVTAA
jgi:hypothetical protein